MRYQIESLTASLKRMDSQVSYSYLNMDLREVVEYQSVTPPPKSFGEKIASAWERAVEKLGDTSEGIILFLIEDGPVLILWILILSLLAWAVVRIRRFIRTRFTRRAAGQPSPPPLLPPKSVGRGSERTQINFRSYTGPRL